MWVAPNTNRPGAPLPDGSKLYVCEYCRAMPKARANHGAVIDIAPKAQIRTSMAIWSG